MLIEPRSWPQHRPWVIGTLGLTLLAGAWYFYWSSGSADWPGGASLPGFTFGVAGGLIILFELLLWLRKKVRSWRIGRAQDWMRAHIWLGLLSLPLLILHSGFRLGGDLATILMVLFLSVIASGIWGLVVQQLIPSKLLTDVPAETIYSQIDNLVGQFCQEAEQLVLATCGPDPKGLTVSAAGEAVRDTGYYLTVGALRSSGRMSGKVLQTCVPSTPVLDTEVLRDFYRNTIEPFLRQGPRGDRSPLREPTRAAVLFRNLRTNLDPAAHGAIDDLEGLCDQRRLRPPGSRLHIWLHVWLWVHWPLSVALFVLMIVHAIQACKYW